MHEFGRLIERQIPALRRYARALTRDAAVADDLVQNCLVRALAKQHLWQPGTDLRAWLFTILHNQRVGDLRRAAREQAGLARADAAGIGAGIAAGLAPALIDLDRALGKLPESQRRVILLLGLEGMDCRASARILGVPVGTVRSRAARGRARLRRLMELDAGETAIAA